MGIISVKFLGEGYEVSEAIKEFLEYDQLLVSMLPQLLERITFCLERDSKSVPSEIYEGIDEDIHL